MVYSDVIEIFCVQYSRPHEHVIETSTRSSLLSRECTSRSTTEVQSTVQVNI